MKQTGNLEQCLSMTAHHCAEYKSQQIFTAFAIRNTYPLQHIDYRFKLVRENMESALAQLRKIRERAQARGHVEIIALLNEEIPFGHDWPEPEQVKTTP